MDLKQLNMKILIKKTTHIGSIRKQNSTQVQQICELLDWSEQAYCEYIFEQYQAFIKRMFYGYPEVVAKQVEYSEIFRGFWNDQVAVRNETEFLPFASPYAGSPNLLEEWLHIHDHRSLMHNDFFMDKYNYCITIIQQTERRIQW
ncbi:MAG: hypothetical protein V4663_06115 [Bacteroidota bacterium]